MTALLTRADYETATEHLIKKAYEVIPTEINRMLPSVWAETNRTLKEGNFQGPFSFEMTPYLREVVDSFSPASPVREVAVLKGTRMGATVGIGENWIGFTIDVAPGEMAYITSGGDMAGAQMELRIDSLINSSGFADKIGVQEKRANQKKTGDIKTRKVFPGGYIMAGGPKAQFIKRAFGFQYLYVDELDSFPDSIDKEGSPSALYRRRVDGYPDSSKILWTSTPLFKHNSKITKLYEEGDQRKYYVPCKHCGHMQFLKFGKKDEPGGLKFEHDEDNRLVEGSVHYECEKCSGYWKNADKDFFLADKSMGGKAEWRPTSTPRVPDMRSYHLPGLLSPVGFRSWESAITQFLNIKHEGFPVLEFQNWVNTFLGEPFEDQAGRPKIEALITSKKDYHVETLPEGAKPLFVTIGSDVQADRLECEIVAWGKNKESWSLNYLIIHGETANSEDPCWEAFRSVVDKEYCGMKPVLTGLDSGFNTGTVYSFCDSVELGIHPVMGFETLKKDNAYIEPKAVEGHTKARININTNMLKAEIYKYLNKGKFESGDIPFGFCHFPVDYDREHYIRLGAERYVKVTDSRGRSKYAWDAGKRRNEQLDCRVYALAMAYGYKDAIEGHLKSEAFPINKRMPKEHDFTWAEFWEYKESV